jgi:hypothetical protein
VRARAEAEQAAQPEPPERRTRQPKQAKPRPTRPGPTELEQVEARIGTLERHVAELEAKLADDWTNMDVLTEHRTARDDLQQLLRRWEELFEAERAEPRDGVEAS